MCGKRRTKGNLILAQMVEAPLILLTPFHFTNLFSSINSANNRSTYTTTKTALTNSHTCTYKLVQISWLRSLRKWAPFQVQAALQSFETSPRSSWRFPSGLNYVNVPHWNAVRWDRGNGIISLKKECSEIKEGGCEFFMGRWLFYLEYMLDRSLWKYVRFKKEIQCNIKVLAHPKLVFVKKWIFKI